jgi:peroxiredoxin
LDGRPVYPLQDTTATAVVLVFVRTDCPLSNRYAPEIQRLQSEFGPQGIPFWLVYPDADTSPEEIRRHLEDYRLTLHALRDPGHAFVRQSGVRVTPEVAVFSRAQLVYRGRIDDRALELGKERPAPTRRDLEEVLASVVQGRVVTNDFTTAVGCYISGEP